MTTPAAQPLVALARAAAEETLGAPLSLQADVINIEGDWAFVLAHLRGADGGPFHFAKSLLAEAAREGLLSDRCAALLRRSDGGWSLLAIAVGPSDPAWLAWTAEHGAPEALFALPD